MTSTALLLLSSLLIVAFVELTAATEEEGFEDSIVPDYYLELGGERTATVKQIKRAFRKLAAKFHPDNNKDPKAGEMFTRLSEANDVLTDSDTRELYDKELGEYEEWLKEEENKTQYAEVEVDEVATNIDEMEVDEVVTNIDEMEDDSNLNRSRVDEAVDQSPHQVKRTMAELETEMDALLLEVWGEMVRKKMIERSASSWSSTIYI